MKSLGAIVVCGGYSRRMGRPKAWLPFGAELLLQRVVRLVSEVAHSVVVVAAPGQALPELPSSVRIARDPVEGRGPLQGIGVGLDALPDEVEFAYATATDVPFMKPAWILHLHSLITDFDLAIPRSDGFLQPLSALYRRSKVAPAVHELLLADRLRPAFLTELVRTRIIEADALREVDPELATVRNLNTPADYRQALRDAGFADVSELEPFDRLLP